MYRALAVLILSCLPGLAHAASGCESEARARSAQGTRATKVVFNNASSERVRVYWKDYGGRRVFYAEVEAGQSYVQDTYMTHPWVVTDSEERCVMMFRPAPGATLATIRD